MGEALTAGLKDAIGRGDFPSAVYLVSERDRIVYKGALGLAVVDPTPIKATEETIYDLASLTKVLVTGLLAAMYVESGHVALDTRVSEVLPAFDTAEKREITLMQLVTHTSGLPAWRPLYLISPREEVLETISRINAAADPDVTYSDLNFIVLAAILERLSNRSLADLAQDRIFGPLGLASTFFNPPARLRGRIAASENGNKHECATCVEMGFLKDTAACEGVLRDYPIWGEVHDGNAWFMGGVSGHAGLFGTAAEVHTIAKQFLKSSTRLLIGSTCELFRKDLTPDSAEHRSFAFQMASTEGSTAGTAMAPESFGHLGFTGTSLWIDPAAERIFLLLTNRTHHHGLPFVNINSVRRAFHTAVIGGIKENA